MITQQNLNDSVPEGMEVIGSTFSCEKHGDVTQALLTIPYAVRKPGETKFSGFEHYFCLQCLAECFDKLIEKGELGKLTITQHVADHETAKRYREEQEKRLAELKAKQEEAIQDARSNSGIILEKEVSNVSETPTT